MIFRDRSKISHHCLQNFVTYPLVLRTKVKWVKEDVSKYKMQLIVLEKAMA